MSVSVFELFKIGIGPSSSHTVGPMVAARRFATELENRGMLDQTSHIHIDLLGSLGATGRGHCSDTAIQLGLTGLEPDKIDPDETSDILGGIENQAKINLLGKHLVGSLYKENASISGADVGCQGEIGVGCSLAAAALAEYLGGTAVQVANAAEIGMEHHLGLTCDPIGGLVQIPCIERNAMGAVQAVNAARMALRRVNKQYVSLDAAIETMRSTGADMNSKYKGTATGGLAVNVTEC